MVWRSNAIKHSPGRLGRMFKCWRKSVAIFNFLIGTNAIIKKKTNTVFPCVTFSIRALSQDLKNLIVQIVPNNILIV